MNRLKRFFHWCCLIGGGAMLCAFALGAMLDNEPVSATAYAGSALAGLIAAAGWHYLKKPPSESE